MARKYDSTRRAEAAQKTREAILDAAFKLHGMGIIDFDALAAEANVSLATIRKYYPSREDLFAGCTEWGMRYAAMPDMDRIAVTAEPEDRLRLTVEQVHTLYESLFGQIWGTYQYQNESPVLTAVMDEFEHIIGPIIDLVFEVWPSELGDDPEARGLVRGLLSFLTYYALRREGGLSQEQASDRIAEAMTNSLRAMSRRLRKEGAHA